MINFNKEVVTQYFEYFTEYMTGKIDDACTAFDKLNKKTKEIVCICTAVMMICTFLTYDVISGVAYASGSTAGVPHAIVAGDEEVAVVQSKEDANLVIESVKKNYGCNDEAETSMITPQINIVEKEYVLAEDVDVLTIDEAVDTILQKNNTSDPCFEVTVFKTGVSKAAIPFETKTVKDSSMKKGTKKVSTEGKNGEKIILSTKKMVNGKVVSSEVYSEEISKEPVTKIIKEGTKVEVKKVEKKEKKNNAPTYNANRGGGVVGYAQQFHGVPYVFGGSTPAGFDCSGFTQYVYRAYGINLPHSSGAQAGYGSAVSYGQAKAGDLVVMPGHVGIYVGGGMMVHAPAPGQSVKTQAIWTGCSFRRLV
ncbi:MAG: NlpC/P60 family protein [Eubacterium sp.]|nr:NlpC/P60 family protein [Eubacterium sp.]